MATNPDPQAFFLELKSSTQNPGIARPNKNLDSLAQEIFDQVRDQRTLLLWFYIIYTAVLSFLVLGLIFWQAAMRAGVYGDEHLELIPEWGLNLIVVGMFGQFIGLLTIVTKRVWGFGPFLEHVKQTASSKSSNKKGK